MSSDSHLLQASGALGNVSTGSEIPQNSGAKGMLPLIEGQEISFGKNSLDSVLNNEGMGGLFGELNNEGGALGQSITGQMEKSLAHQVATQPNGQPGLSLENMGSERFQPPPNVSGDTQLKPLSARGGAVSQGG